MCIYIDIMGRVGMHRLMLYYLAAFYGAIMAYYLAYYTPHFMVLFGVLFGVLYGTFMDMAYYGRCQMPLLFGAISGVFMGAKWPYFMVNL